MEFLLREGEEREESTGGINKWGRDARGPTFKARGGRGEGGKGRQG